MKTNLLCHASALVLIACIAGCSGGGTSARMNASAESQLAILIKVPIKLAASSVKRTPRYVSYATKSIQINVDPGTAAERRTSFDLTPTSGTCTPSGVLGYLTCSLSLTVTPGTHALDAIMYDQTGGTVGGGAKLSASYAYPFTITAGAANTISFSLGGIPSTISIAPANPGEVTYSAALGFRFVTTTSTQRFFVYALDADQNAIVGPNSPVLLLQSPDGAYSVRPVPGNPNAFDLVLAHVSRQFTPTATIIASASNVTGSTDAPLTRTVAFNTLNPIVITCANSCYGDNNTSQTATFTIHEDGYSDTGGFNASGFFVGTHMEPLYVTTITRIGPNDINVTVQAQQNVDGPLDLDVFDTYGQRAQVHIIFYPPSKIVYDSRSPYVILCPATGCYFYAPILLIQEFPGHTFLFENTNTLKYDFYNGDLYRCVASGATATITLMLTSVQLQYTFTITLTQVGGGLSPVLTVPAKYTSIIGPIYLTYPNGSCTFKILDTQSPGPLPVDLTIPFHLE